MRDQRKRLLIGSLLSLFLLVWVIWRTDWGEIFHRLLEADLALVLAAFTAVGVGILLRAWRWAIMLEPKDDQRSFRTVFDIVSLGYLANNLLPARLGDFLRAYLAREWSQVSLSFALSTTVVERVLDTLVVVIMLFAVLPFLPVPPLAARTGMLVGVALVIAGLFLVIAAWQRSMSERIIRTLLRPLPLDEKAWSERLVALLDGFALVGQPGRFARVLFSTILIWAISIFSYWATFRAFDLNNLGIADSVFTISLAALGMAAPSGPAAAGTFDAAAGGALQILGVPARLAYGVAVVLHTINFVTITLVGLWSMARRGMSLGALSSRAEEVEKAGQLKI